MPKCSDKKRDRLIGDLNACVETIKLQRHFDIMHLLGIPVEPQYMLANLRGYTMIKTQMIWGDKLINVYASRHMPTEQRFEMIRLGFRLLGNDFENGVLGVTDTNFNSPRMLGISMA